MYIFNTTYCIVHPVLSHYVVYNCFTCLFCGINWPSCMIFVNSVHMLFMFALVQVVIRVQSGESHR